MDGLNKVIFAFNPNQYALVYHGPTRSDLMKIDVLHSCSGSSCSTDNTGAIVGGAVGGVVGGLALCLLLIVIALLLFLLARKKQKEAQLLLAEEWSDDEVEMDDMSEVSNSSASRSTGISRHLSMVDLESVNLSFSPQV